MYDKIYFKRLQHDHLTLNNCVQLIQYYITKLLIVLFSFPTNVFTDHQSFEVEMKFCPIFTFEVLYLLLGLNNSRTLASQIKTFAF